MSYIHFSADLVCVKFISLNVKTNHIAKIDVYITITNYMDFRYYSLFIRSRKSTDNKMTKQKRTNNGLLSIAQKTKIEQHELH
jgi:hypothetical protein